MATPTSLFEITTIIPKIRVSINEFPYLQKDNALPFPSSSFFLTRARKKLTDPDRLAQKEAPF